MPLACEIYYVGSESNLFRGFARNGGRNGGRSFRKQLIVRGPGHALTCRSKAPSAPRRRTISRPRIPSIPARSSAPRAAPPGPPGRVASSGASGAGPRWPPFAAGGRPTSGMPGSWGAASSWSNFASRSKPSSRCARPLAPVPGVSPQAVYAAAQHRQHAAARWNAVWKKWMELAGSPFGPWPGPRSVPLRCAGDVRLGRTGWAWAEVSGGGPNSGPARSRPQSG